MKANEYKLIQDCIEKGVERGWYRAHKHSDTPDEEAIKLAMEDAVLAEISEYFYFEGADHETAN